MPDCPSCGTTALVINSRLSIGGLRRSRRYVCTGTEKHRFTLKEWTVHPDGLAAAKAQAISGCCIFCEEPLPPHTRGRPPLICANRGCRQSYFRAHGRDRCRRNPDGWRRWYVSEHVTWHCGCGLVTRRSGWGIHKKACIFASWAWPVVVVTPRRMAA